MNKRTMIFLSIIVVMIIGAIIVWLLLGKWMEKGLQPQADGTTKYAIILGAKVDGETPSLSLKYRLDEAVTYGKKYPDVLFVLSGGQGEGEHITEAEAMRRYLVEHGIDESRLMIEDASTSTYENIKLSLEKIAEEVEKITIISSDYHLARAQFIAKKLGVETDVVAAQTPNIVKAKLNIRERLALLKTFVVGK